MILASGKTQWWNTPGAQQTSNQPLENEIEEHDDEKLGTQTEDFKQHVYDAKAVFMQKSDIINNQSSKKFDMSSESSEFSEKMNFK